MHVGDDGFDGFVHVTDDVGASEMSEIASAVRANASEVRACARRTTARMDGNEPLLPFGERFENFSKHVDFAEYLDNATDIDIGPLDLGDMPLTARLAIFTFAWTLIGPFFTCCVIPIMLMPCVLIWYGHREYQFVDHP